MKNLKESLSRIWVLIEISKPWWFLNVLIKCHWIDTRVLFTEKLATYWLIDIQTHNRKLKHFWTGCYLELSWAPKSGKFYRSQDISENRSNQLMENNNLIYNLNNKIIIFKNDIFFLDATSDLNPTGLYQKKSFLTMFHFLRNEKSFKMI